MSFKIPFYNAVNFLLTGLVFVGCMCIIYFSKISYIFSSSIFDKICSFPGFILGVCFISVMYEIGLIMNRIGSVFIEPFLRKIKFIEYNDNYNKYDEKSLKNPKMDILSREYVLSRTSCVEFFVLSIISLINHTWNLSILFIIAFFAFLFSTKKYAGRITKLMQ